MSSAHSRSVTIERPGEHRLTSGPVPEPGPGEVRVRVAAAGICMSDREVYDGHRDPAYVRYPVVPGHEWSGVVDALGAGVDPALLGRRTVAEGFRSCGSCERCRSGETSLCTTGYDETGFTRPGAFADHVVVPARLLHPLADDADLRAAALLEPAAVVAAAVRAGAPEPGERIAVVGAGTLGLLAVQLLSVMSPGELTVIDPRDERAGRSLAFGASEARTPKEATEVRGRYDLVVETAGAPSTAADACLLARRGGRVVLTGMFAPGAAGIDPVHLSLSQLTVRSVFGAPSAAWSYAVRAFTAGLLDPAALITHEFPLERFADAVALVGGGGPATGKVLLRP
ncbi:MULTISPECIES: alcohol dehydrogenase catalytic domain-containing protein [unclassified Streptomyces]|uniref:zinc-dependent alcohol dehydrogenase n=1 Tax=unclassified Streptomyces TaxID=2593676 RepID=UPI002DD8B127|nr:MULTISPECIES: alcohol dehydrogenase catalytic domain-containing protein [unclassified Streptomyces]WSC40218.1 alcohol dehydrogenase catalytic domain-containing protein [Streptomyces sp. NBC_01763]WSC48386.1 alcohol dehydrogenase catalytic domain-containing protein [Streptomyces sp. NBC_01762]WSD28038.1 alcohol dehydrogenase catalytic domain-containing protein [Streptomyces sp. NBC_01751]WSJ49965.1 alcohol dehydrogenase catalytic domain-containing protein [Streptomyces sp. NBC_01318]